MKKPIANMAASVRERLHTLAKKQGEAFEQVLIRYALERLLYRLSLSEYADRFVLKGALLFRLWFDLEQRPTRDADFLGNGPAEPAAMKEIFQKLANTTVEPEDGLSFDGHSVTAEEIRKEAGYPGIRITMRAELAKARIPVQCDIGFGDVMTPAPVRQNYPVLLDMPAPSLRVYPLETVVAEKLEALVKRGVFNSRLKDYFDLWVLMGYEHLDQTLILQAIRATFRHRETQTPQTLPAGLTGDFSASKQTAWQAFLKRSSLTAPPLEEVVTALREFYWPMLRAAAARN